MPIATTGQKEIKKNEETKRRGHKYVGQQKKAVRHGYGVYTYTNQFFQYEGNWVDGKKEGIGKFLMKDGSYYYGEFNNGEIEGNGMRYFALNGSKYTGTFHKGELHGKGIMKYKNGSVYDGTWDHNKREGYGILKEKDRYTYKGTFQQNKKHGSGTQNYENGDIYEGGWVQGQRHGHGYLKTSDGTFYKGQWANDVMSGMGYMTHSSGIIYDGYWINGLPQILATKLAFMPNQEALYIDKGQSFKIEVQCHNDDKVLIQEEGRRIQLIAGMQYYPDTTDSAKDLEKKLIQTPYGYRILPCSLNIMPLEQTSTCENMKNIENDDELENTKPEIQDSPLPDEIAIKTTIKGKVVWEDILHPTACVEKKYFTPQECKKKLAKNVARGNPMTKPKKEIQEFEEKLNEFVLVAKDITQPPFMNQRLQTAFLKVKFNQQKNKSARK